MKRIVVKLTAPVATLAVGAVLLAGGTPSSRTVRAAPQPSPAASVDYGGKGKPPIVRSPFLHPYFTFDSGVSRGERAFVRRAVLEANRFFTIPHRKDPPDSVEVYVFRDRDALLDHYAARTGVARRVAEREWTHIAGVASSGWTTIDLSFAFSNDDAKRALIYHEWFHLVDGHVHGYREEAATWLVEGMAEWAGWRAAIRFGDQTSLDQLTVSMRIAASTTDRSLRSMEGARVFYGTDPLMGAYATAFWAIEYLDPTIPKLLRFSKRLGETGYWESAFQDVFGMRVQRFYKGFERFRARGFRA